MIRATYRFQFHKDFTLADAEARLSYLDALGISHVYASPVTMAAAGSTHGYDVVDPTRINPELGGEEAFRSLARALKARGMGLILDIVPNHMGVAGGGNGWWRDVQRHGQASRYARFFDVDWRRKLVLPVLGAPLSQAIREGAVAVERDGEGAWLVAYGEHRFPLRPEDDGVEATTDAEAVRAVHERQHYRLAHWRVANDELNWRRFFTISELAGLRQEDRQVFEETHALIFRLWDEGLIDGVRIDHVDGLTDPAAYCRDLRERLGEQAGIWVEKILGAGEPLARDWAIDGTSGYDFMEEVAALLHAPDGEAPLRAFWSDLSERPGPFSREELLARQEMLRWSFEGQLAACVEAFATLAAADPATEGLTAGMLRRAIERLLWVWPVYRTYGTGSAAPAGDAQVRETARSRAARFTPPGEAGVVDAVLGWLVGEGPGEAADAVRRFQQLSAPIAAKAVEDTAFYRHAPLLSRTDVGFDAERFSMPVGEWHERMAARAADWPGAMLTTATHDHKRGEDVRARLAVLSELADEWRGFAEPWLADAGEVDRGDAYALLQTLLGAWPEGLRADDRAGLEAFGDRVIAWQEKALREAKLRSSWEQPDETYEGAASALARRWLEPAQAERLARFVMRIAAPALANTLAQVALRCTVPGVPDLYQGAELLDLSLVDPDNRRPVDYGARERLLATPDGSTSAAKLVLLRRLLDLRRRYPALFAEGDYQPLSVTGERAAHVVAFRRTGGGAAIDVAVAIRCAGALAGGDAPVAPRDWWGDTAVDGPGPAAALFATGPVFDRVTGDANV